MTGLHNLSSLPVEPPPSDLMVAEYLANSLVLGILLMMISVWSATRIAQATAGLPRAPGAEVEAPFSRSEAVLSAANVLFLCFGMTGIMILVNNNIARAFAIGAAIALVRFKIKLEGLGTTLFFGVLTGMACGVGQLQTAWTMAAAFALLQLVILGVLRKTSAADVRDARAAAIVLPPAGAPIALAEPVLAPVLGLTVAPAPGVAAAATSAFTARPETR